LKRREGSGEKELKKEKGARKKRSRGKKLGKNFQKRYPELKRKKRSCSY
jgi:hypothetical protein